MPTKKRKALSVLIVSTLAFTVCFAVWMMFAVIGIPIKKTLNLNETEFGILTATPVLTGSLIRVPLGMWTDKFGGRIVLFLLMIATVIPIWLISYATEFWHFLGQTKKWWLLPILIVVFAFAILVFFSGTAAAPFIYTLF